jgi:hypothetical protein
MGEGVALRGLRWRWRLRRPRHIGSSCDVLESSARSKSRASADSARSHRCCGRRPQRPLAARPLQRWHLQWHAIVSSRAVQSRASARSQALDATCVSRKNYYVVHGDASFCAERKIPTNIAGIADIVTAGLRANARRPEERLQTRHTNRIQSLNPPLFLKKRGFQDRTQSLPLRRVFGIVFSSSGFLAELGFSDDERPLETSGGP